MTLPRILSAVGRTLAVLGAVMLLFVVFQLWGTGLQQAQAQSDLEGDLAERFRQAAEAGQAARTLTAGPPQAAAPGGPSPAGTAPAPPQPVGDESGTAPAATGDAAPGATASGDPASGDPASAGPAGGPATPADPGQPGSGAAVATTDEPRAAASDPGRSAAGAGDAEAGDAGPAAGGATADASPPAPLPDLPSAPRVVSHVSELAAARATARLLEPEVEELLPLVYPEPGEAIARIIIPSIDMDEIVVAGVDVEDLRKGPGHYSTTPLPGQPGNAAIAGHRTTYGAPFGRLADLNAGDAIIVETLQGRFTYRVLPGQPGMAGHALGFRIVAPTALEVLDDVGDNRLTLTSCHPKYSSKKRIIVHAALVGDPVVRLPRPGEPTGAEHVQLAQPGGPPPVPPNVAAPQTPTPETLPSGTIPSEPTPSEAASPAAASPAAASPAAGSSEASPSEAGGAGEGNQAGTSPGTAPELAGEPAGVAAAAIAGDEPGTPVPESAGSGGDAGDPAATAEPPSPGTEPGALPSGETDGATVGAARGDTGQGGQSRQPAAANPTAPQPPPAPVTSEGFGEGLSGDRDAILPAVLWGLAAAAVWALGWMFGRSGRRALRYTVAAVPFLVVIYVMFSYVDRALPAY